MNILVTQSGGPTMVINQSLAGVVSAAQASGKCGKFFGSVRGIDGILSDNLVDMTGISSERLGVIAGTPSSALGSARHKPTADDCASILDAFRRHDIGAFFCIGGNDSAETAGLIANAAKEAGAPVTCFHVPKTIDNDLRENDHTPGYGSAARFVASAFMGDDLDNRALGGVKIDVVMGRHAGFLTAASALARVCKGAGPHLIYIPERPFSEEGFLADVENSMKVNGRCVIAVSEGISDVTGTPIAAKFSSETDSHGNMQLSGTGALGDALSVLVKGRLGIKRVRADTFGYLQRSFPGIASATDAAEAHAVGIEAFNAAVSGKYESGSIAIKREDCAAYSVRYEVVPLQNVARNTRSMPDEFIAASGNDVTDAFVRYAAPLVGDLPRIDIL